jgi:hypothetical protein
MVRPGSHAIGRCDVFLNDIYIRPLFHSFAGWQQVNLTVEYENLFKGIPLILSGVWPIEEVKSYNEMGIMASPNRWLKGLEEFYSTERPLAPYTIDGGEAYIAFSELEKKVGPGKIKIVRLDIGDFDEPVSLEFVKMVRDNHPGLVIIAGNVTCSWAGQKFQDAGADIVSFGTNDNPDDVYEMTGVAIPSASVLQDNVSGWYQTLAAFRCRTPGDVAKCFALGADFVEIGPDLADYSIQDIFRGVQIACVFSGAKSIVKFQIAADVRRRDE